MGFWPGKSKQPGDAAWRNRQAERYGTASVRCQLGTVVDMSATGMRLLCDKKPPVAVGQVFATKISFDDGAMPLQVQTRWIRRRGLRQFELGLQFVALKSGADRVLEAVAKFGLASAAKATQDASAAKPGVKNKRSPGQPQASSDLPDYFAVMDLKRDATPQQIKASYRRLAVAWHPDRCDAPDAMAKFERLHEAYEVLSDSKRRETYLEMTG